MLKNLAIYVVENTRPCGPGLDGLVDGLWPRGAQPGAPWTPWTLEMRQGEGGGCSREPNGPQAQLSLPAAISLMIQQ